MKKYIVSVNYTPEIHEGIMSYYWHVDLITNDGVFTVADGWDEDVYYALCDALDWADVNVK